MAGVLSACGALVDRATANFARDLERAVVNYDEPGVVEHGLPAFLLILEARREANPDDADLLRTLSSLTATYAGLFIDEEAAARRMNARALNYAERAACIDGSVLCGAADLSFLDFEQRAEMIDSTELETAYSLGGAWVGWIAAHRADYAALADLPKAELLLQRVAELSPEHDDGAVWLYLAVLNSQRPPAAGGRADLARSYFERAREISGGRNLLVDVFMADSYARLMFDRELWVELLDRVLAADPDQPGFVLANQIAQARARELHAQTARIFD
ncbi:MAG: hypothetical protein CVV18_03375 [Gammaproteobacteria bacterium HGW-Gammaproteobacteria-8]|nr:MAG: hypothetical protein CVV18_03375 [Gammaproteobacteria bacterium HGW-Gammaproteobacteria-8]